MQLRQRLKQSAETQLSQLVEQLEKRAIELCADYPIEPQQLARLVCSPSTSVLTKKLVSKMATQAEEEMVQEYERKQEIY